jgi:hypothetical protein
LIVRGFAQLFEAVELQTQKPYRSLVAPCEGDRLVELNKSQVSARQSSLGIYQAKRAQLSASV